MRWVFLQLFRIFDMNKTITTLLAAAGIAASAPASAMIVGGVDFGALGRIPLVLIWKLPHWPKPLSTVTGKMRPPTVSSPPSMATHTYCADGSSNCGLYYVANFNNSQNFSPELRRIHRYDCFSFLQQCGSIQFAGSRLANQRHYNSSAEWWKSMGNVARPQ